MTEDITDGIGTYDVVLLVEHGLTEDDASRVHSLHDQITDQVVYHVLLPLDDAAERIQAAMGSLSASDPMAIPLMSDEHDDLDDLRRESEEVASENLARSLRYLRTTGAQAEGLVVRSDVIKALISKVNAVDAREAFVVTSPHVVAEFFKLDWTSKARRHVGVPVLHLIEHETFDEQAFGGEGVTGL